MLGSSLCRLYEKTDEVYAFHRDGVCYASCSANFSLNLMENGKLKELFSGIKPNLIIHCAGLTNLERCERAPDLAYDANVTITKHIARICSENTKFVYISTDQVYGEDDNHSELNIDLRPVNIYGKTKLQGERKVQEYNLNHIIIRTNIFGWNVKPGKISSAEWIYYSLKKNETIKLFDDYFFSPIYTECLGEIIMQLAQMDFSGVVNAGSPEPCSKYAFGIQLSEVFGFDKSRVIKCSIAEHNFEAARPNNLTLNSQRLFNLCIPVPDYKTSIKTFYENRPES